MNKTLRSILKITTSLLTVCMVILATCAAPALALSADGNYRLYDYVTSNQVVDGQRLINFRIPGEPLFCVTREREGGVIYLYNGDSWSPLPYESKATFRVYPLGVQKATGQNATQGLLDISDLKRTGYLSIEVEMQFDIQWSMSSPSLYGTFNSFWGIHFYDENGKYISTFDTAAQRVNVEFSSMVDSYVPVKVSVHTGFPENAYYCLPYMVSALTFPVAGSGGEIGSGGYITSIGVHCSPFSLDIAFDQILYDSLTYERIAEELGELNDKADVIINGSEDMQDKADEITNEGQDLDEQLDAALEDLEELEENSGQDLSAPIQSISDFLRDGSWFSIIDLIKPIMDFPPLATILTILVAFINISILFFGR